MPNTIIKVRTLLREIPSLDHIKLEPHITKDVHNNPQVTLNDVLQVFGVHVAYQALASTSISTTANLRADIAESVLHLYRQKFVFDTRLEKCINTLRQYARNVVTIDDVKAAAEKVLMDCSRPCKPLVDTCSCDTTINTDSVFQAVVTANSAATSKKVYTVALQASNAVQHSYNKNTDQWSVNEKLLCRFIHE